MRFALVLLVVSPILAAEDGDASRERRRRPVAIVATAERVSVANRASGSIVILDPVTHAVTNEVVVGRRLSDLVAVPNSRLLLATDEAAHRVLVLRPTRDGVTVATSSKVATSPVGIAVHPEGRIVAVTSLWSRRLTLFTLSGERLRTERVIDLPFAPRALNFTPNGTQLLVADAFAGRFATLDVGRFSQTVRAGDRESSEAVKTQRDGRFGKPSYEVLIRELDAHNVRAVLPEADGRSVLVAHQIANPLVPTHRQRVFWGAIVANQLRRIPLDEFTRTGSNRIGRFELHPLGQPERAAGDPSAVAVASDGRILVTTAGTDELHLRTRTSQTIKRLRVGRRPLAVSVSPDEQTAYVANTLDDSVSVVDLDTESVTATVSLGPTPPSSLVDRGESLFFDSRLSLNGWYSCHSCHGDGHTNGRLIDNLSDGSEGTPKLTPTLLGTGDTRPWAWNGTADFLEKQVHASILKTMQGRPEGASEENVRAITAYLRTLQPPPPLSVARGTFDRAASERGRRVFDANGCAHCHMPLKYTNEGVRDVGLEDEAGETYFNAPSLRGVSQRDRFYHDGSVTRLRDVLTTDTHADFEPLEADELRDLLAFLRGL